MPREQQGQLIWREGYGWYGRFYATVDGERVRICRALGTDNKAVAKRKLKRLIASSTPAVEDAKRLETFQEAAERVLDAQKAAGMATWKDRQHRLKEFVFSELGQLPVDKVRAAHVVEVLEAVRDQGKSRQTLIHIKTDVSAVLGALWRAEILPENVTQRVQVPQALPDVAERSKKERAVLSDLELAQYLAWEHPNERFRKAVLERQTMACVSRMFGGLRTSDLHAMRWEAFDAAGGFEWGYAPRRKGLRLAKGSKPQKLVVPEMLRPILRDWWERKGKPLDGLVFPKRRGKDAGKAGRKKSSHAQAFRRDLRRVFGIEQWDAETESWKVVEDRPLTARERVLLEETEFTLPVEFHSWRRAYNQALADAGVNAQHAQALAGHSTMAAHERYLRNTEKMRTIPEGALPRLTIGHSVVGTPHELPQNDVSEPETPLLKASGMFEGSADETSLGAGCCRFKSCHPDRKNEHLESCCLSHRAPRVPEAAEAALSAYLRGLADAAARQFLEGLR